MLLKLPPKIIYQTYSLSAMLSWNAFTDSTEFRLPKISSCHLGGGGLLTFMALVSILDLIRPNPLLCQRLEDPGIETKQVFQEDQIELIVFVAFISGRLI
jgi:hypothetical protein